MGVFSLETGDKFTKNKLELVALSPNFLKK
jgi:hypothetical protein